MTRLMRTIALVRMAATLAFALALPGCGGTSVTPNSANSANSAGTAQENSTTSTATDSIAFSASNYSVDQGAGSVTLTVTRAGAATAAISIDYATSDGTALAGTDYTAGSGTLNWAENDSTSKSISILVSSAIAFYGDKSFGIVLSNPTDGATIGSPGSATVTISGASNSATAGTLQLADAAYTVSQSTQSVTITVNRTGGTIGATTVTYSTTNGTAIAGADYTATSGALEWEDGDATSKSFSVAISSATPFSGNKTFNVALSGATSGAMIGSPYSATVTISGDASAAVGSLQLAAANYNVSQNAGTWTVSVNRTGGSNGAASVSYSTTSGTAVAGTDFTAASGTLNWADGDATSKSFSVVISNATPFSGSKNFTVALSNLSAGATISSPGSATVTISGDGSLPVGSFVLSASGYTVAQNAGMITVGVNRIGGANGAASVSYSTTSGTAVAGTDFTAASGTLNWADGDATSKSFSVVISNAISFSGNKSFTVELSNPSIGAAIGTPIRVAVTISGDAVAAAVGSLQLSGTTYAIAQSTGSLTITVNRTGGSGGAVTVSYAAANGTAVAETDFTASSGTLNWANGDAASKTFSVVISKAPAFSGSKIFTVALSNPSAGATISSPGSATVTISGSASTSGSTFWVYHDGAFNWGGDYSSGAVPNYSSTAGNPESGPYDIAVTLTETWGLWQPYAGGTVPTWDFNASGYNYITMDLKPTVANQVWQVYFMQVHDVSIIGANGQRTMINLADYGPAPVVGQWATYKIPLSVVLTQYSSGAPVYETGVYKFAIQDQTGLSQNTWYVDNVGFTR
jgi:hypothetical protein